MVKVYYEEDANMELINSKKIAVIGYGSQGHAHAQNLRDSGASVVVGLREGSSTVDRVKADGLEVAEISSAVKGSNVVVMLIPDDRQAAVFKEKIGPNLDEGDTLVFAHGFNIHFDQIAPPTDVDVIMVAPKGPGHMVRKTYQEGSGVPSLIAVEQDYSGNAKDLALSYAKGLGATRAGVLETTFAEETETDLFGEQTVLCGGVSELIKAGFDTLTEAGYQPEVAYFECLHEVKLIVDLIQQYGITGMRKRVSDTAEYGDMTRGKRVIDERVRATMKEILEEIRSGEFAREWIEENESDRPLYHDLESSEATHPIEVVGRELRSMMSWLSE